MNASERPPSPEPRELENAASLADFDHDIVQTLRRVVRPGTQQTFELDEEGIDKLRAVILAYADDDSLPAALIATFGLASVFYQEQNSQSAARAVILLIGELEPQLSALKRADGPLRDQIERSIRTNKFAEAPTLRAPGLNAPAPQGTVKLSDFLRPSGRPVR